MVYKLVARTGDDGRMVGVAKASKDKLSIGGRKWALRRRDERGVAEAEIIGIGARPTDDGDDRDLMVDLVVGGEVVGAEHCTLRSARARHDRSVQELPRSAHQLSRGEPAIRTVYLEEQP
jgi:nicotinate phosphoribosyltransferase